MEESHEHTYYESSEAIKINDNDNVSVIKTKHTNL